MEVITHLTKFEIFCALNSEEQGRTVCPFKIKPDCSVFAKGHPFRGTDSSTIKLLIQFKRWHEDDPFVIGIPQPQVFSSDNTTRPPSSNPFMKSSCDGHTTCGQITAYATLHLSTQYRTHVFFVLICGEYVTVD